METSALSPMTELDAINDMLSIISESPVASIEEAEGFADAQIALQLLRQVNRQVQSKGWHWNTEEEYRLTPNTDGEIELPTNTIKVDPSDIGEDYVIRGGKLWDKPLQTFKINIPVYVDIVLCHPFEDLPETARTYIATLAARKFENRMQGDGGANQINERDVTLAWADLLQEECDNADYNVIKDSPTVNRISKNRRG